MEYYTLEELGRPGDLPEEANWYEDDWYLMEHQDFYKQIYIEQLRLLPKDFTKVPTRAVFGKHLQYLSLKDSQGEPDRAARRMFRLMNLDLDAWLVLAGGYTPITPTPTTPTIPKVTAGSGPSRKTAGVMPW